MLTNHWFGESVTFAQKSFNKKIVALVRMRFGRSHVVCGQFNLKLDSRLHCLIVKVDSVFAFVCLLA